MTSRKKTSLLKKITQGGLVSSVIAGSSIVNGSSVSLIGLGKLFSSSKRIDRAMLKYANQWISTNNWLIDKTLTDLTWDIYIDPQLDLNLDGRYIMTCNHQSWVDTTVNQYFVRHRMPLTRFFAKWELIFVPFAGQAFKALGFPMMKRHSKAQIEKNPALKYRDLEEARKACEQLLNAPFTLLNYLEGTRFSPKKHEQQQSPYQHLLKPKAGGLALALNILGQQVDALVDMTIVYEDAVPDYSEFWLGQTQTIRVHVRKIDIPTWILQGSYADDADYRQRFQTWVDDIWQQKDALIEQMKQQKTAQIAV
ncbi:MAG: acyltransferase [Acinetobacter sp.]|nr:acyltransferase [Acinetobacter sp.]